MMVVNRRPLPSRGLAAWALALMLTGCIGRAARFDYGSPPAPPIPNPPIAPPASPQLGPLPLDQLAAFIRWRNRRLDLATADRLAQLILAESQSEHVDPRLVSSVVAVESSFDSRAVSSTGAQGLGQLLPSTARDLGVKNAFDPADNLMGTARYLAWLLALWNGRADLALASYTAGPEAVRREVASGHGLEPDQSRYVQVVLSMYVRLTRSPGA